MSEPLHGVGGRLSGAAVVFVVLLLVVLGVTADELAYADWFFAALALVAVLAWGAMLRPAAWLEADRLVLRNMYETVRVPLVAITTAEVRSVLVVRTATGRYLNSATGRSRRQQLRGGRGQGGFAAVLDRGRTASGPDPDALHEEFVEQRILARVRDARARAGLPEKPRDDDPTPPSVERTPAWLEIAATVLAVLALLLTILL